MIGVRFALYADLMLLFGLPLFALYAPGGRDTIGVRWPALAILALLGLALSLLSIALMTASMAGVPLDQVDPDAIRMMVTDTPMGQAWVVRMIALAVLLGVILIRHRAFEVAALLAAFALGSLAWTGHGAAGEGSAGTFQMVADIAHMLAAAAWIGALVGLGTMVFGTGDLKTAYAALDQFSRAGSIIVGIMIASGLINSAYLVGVSHLADLPSTLYGQLLIVKLVLFTGMLVIAAHNRFRLTPALAPIGGSSPSFGAIRLSLSLEAGAATAILALVAWIGTLQPPMSA